MTYQILSSGLLAVTALGAAALLLSLSLVYKYRLAMAELVAQSELLAHDCQQLVLESGKIYDHGWEDCNAEWQGKVLWQDGYDTCLADYGLRPIEQATHS